MGEKARKFDRGVSGLSDEYRKIVEHVKYYSDSETVVLDAACGTGIVAFVIAQYIKAVAATDLSANMVGVAKRKAEYRTGENIDFLVADAYELPFIYKAFDVVLLANVLHVVKEPSTLLAEMRRDLRL